MKNFKIKLLSILSLMILTSTLTGCNVKFIEKAPEKETETSEDLGQIEDNPNDSEHLSLEEVEDPNTTETSEEKSEETTIESTETSTLGENQQEVNGVIFNMETKTMYIKTNTKLYANAKLTGTASTGVTQGSKITMYGLSEDGKVAMVKSASSSTMYFIAYEYLSEDVIEYSSEETLTESETSESEQHSSETPSSTTSEEQPSSQEQPSTQRPQETNRPQQPVDNGGGIAYPSNPSSTSINFGVTFADETFTATAVATTTVNDQPGKVLNSTGITAIKTLNKGDTIKCTGIGQNGYIRVIINEGQDNERIGFVLNTDLKR